MYVFYRSSLPVKMLPDERDQNMIDFTVTLWTNFAKYYNPTPKSKEWTPITPKQANYVILEDSRIKNRRDSERDKRIAFWKSLE